MVSRGGRCLCSVLILTGFLLGATNGVTTMAPAPATTPAICTPILCQNGGTCMEDTDMCQCAPGYEGVTCETDLCALLACQNGGTCNKATDPVSCICTDSWQGPDCSDDIDECLRTNDAYPCDAVNGNCTNTRGSYMCTCNLGFETNSSDPSACSNINDCSSDTCQNGGTCNDLVNDYNCTCPDGFNGTHCEFDIDACEPEPCENEGNCTNHLMNSGDANFTCLCMPGWTGRNCSEGLYQFHPKY